MRRLEALLFIVVIPPNAARAWAQDSLTLTAARERVRDGSPLVIAARGDSAAIVNRGRQASLRPPGDLSLDVGGEGPFKRPRASLEYVEPLRVGSRTDALKAIGAADEAREGRRVQVGIAAAQLAVTRAFARSALLQRRLAVDSEDAAAVSDLAAESRRRREMGFATDIDVLRLEAEAGAAQRRVTRDRYSLVAARSTLAAELGLSGDSLPPLALDARAPLEDSTALSLIAAINGAGVEAAEQAVARAAASTSLAAHSKWTDPGVGGGAGYEEGEPILLALVRIPIPARNGNADAIAAAEGERRAADARLIAARRRAAALLAEARAQRASALEQMHMLERDLETRRTAESLARRRLEEGGPFLQIWLDVRRDRLALERERLDLELALLSAKAPGALDEATRDPLSATAGEGETGEAP